MYPLSKENMLTKSKIFETMSQRDPGCGPGGGRTTDDVLHKAGIVIATNKYNPNSRVTATSCASISKQRRKLAVEIISPWTAAMKEQRIETDGDTKMRTEF
ncbi:Complement C3-like protein [Argiope bruennichi]|uniref:Complement C3-like protein n=1 Tax=Argiope bruennichi TaxID=94029 RepID=A0A8T0EFZ8_ARGBR|nr:Complement C3-like protein [Argiope bruennichi]